MADKQISELTAASNLTDSTLLVVEQGGSAKKANWGMMKNYISPGVAQIYSSSSTYAVGDYVLYQNTLYRCATPITTVEAWTAAHWTAAVLGDDVSNLKGAITPIELIDFAAYSGDISTETGKYINYSGVRGDASWNKLYTLTPANGQVVKITAYASLNSVPAFWYNGVAYPANAQSEAAEYSGYIIGDGTSLLRVNSVISSGTEVQPPDILIDAHATVADLDAVETDVSKIETGQKLLFTDVTANKNNNRYINFSGVRGDASWNNMYDFVPQYGVQYAITTRTSAGLPAFYYKAPYPASQQSAEYSYSGYIIGDGATSCYVNCLKDASGNEIQSVDIKVINYAPSDTRQKTDTLTTISGIERGTQIATTDTANRFILATGVRGTLSGYTLKEFTTMPDAVYLVYSEVEANRAAGGFPIALCNGVNYTNATGKGYYIIIGNGQKCYVNSLSTVTTIIEQYSFKAFVERTPNVFRMFDNIVCCGDSLTYSQVYTSNNASRQALVTYPETLAKITGTQTVTLATPGYTCKNWWDNYAGQITGANKLYLIYLGTNESDSSLTNTADTDCAGDDYTQYAENGTGYYGRIIRKILDTQSRCILIKIGLGTTGNNRNAAISGLAERFAVPVVNNPQYVLNDMYYHYGDTTDYYNTVHLNDMGYGAFAEMIADEINNLPLSTKYSLMPKTAN